MNDQPTKASNFNLKVEYPSADVGEALKAKRLKLSDARLGIKDQLNNETPISREQDETDSKSS